MKTKLYLTALLAAFMMLFTSCDSSEALIKAEVKAADMQCPMDIGSGLSMVSVEYDGSYVIYGIKGSDDMYQFSQDLVTEDMKATLVGELRARAASNESVKKFMDALKNNNVGVKYHYYTESTSMDAVIDTWEL